ncbi:hypothetical protein B1776_02590 [Dehalococcoides mccartyi]|uniref:DUF3786 domain-containing protein n=1 Tax=Dehalococcoides mccartyi TaxID=61435 RepID=UPI00099DAD36|nr:DUF3786 domain-containing protein [Dehalococcoides mccartyi]AQX74468.1 hypothetical protein B1776_02590 [Dehalococcoides mccartyi]
MTNPKEGFSLPAQRNFELATKRTLELNRSHFLAVQDFDKISRQAGAVLQPPFIHLKYFRFRVEIDTRNAAVTSPDTSLSPREEALILHYLLKADGTPVSREQISFKELPEGANYQPVFYNRVLKSLIALYIANPAKLNLSAISLGGKKAEQADVSFLFQALPRLPLWLVFWQGDDEFPPEGNIIFDRSISRYLDTEAITEICQNLNRRLTEKTF